MVYGVMKIHARWGTDWNLLIKDTVPSMTFCIVWLCFVLILSSPAWISFMYKLKIFLNSTSYTDPLRKNIWLWLMKLFNFSLVIYLSESEITQINLNPTFSSNLLHVLHLFKTELLIKEKVQNLNWHVVEQTDFSRGTLIYINQGTGKKNKAGVTHGN